MFAVEISPFLVLAATTVFTLLLSAFTRSRFLPFAASAGGLCLAAIDTALIPKPGDVGALFRIDWLSAGFMILILIAAFVVALFSREYWEAKNAESTGEFYILLLLATLGSLSLVASTHLASLFVGLEILSISLYALIAYRYQEGDGRGMEAGLKYLVLAGTSSAFLLFGMALVYAGLGSLEFARIAPRLGGLSVGPPMDPLACVGTAMILVGVGFKLALAPFHLWSPDVYDGAPAPVTAYVATVSKVAVFALLLRYFAQADLRAGTPFYIILFVLATLSMFVGNALALRQSNVRRLLAYSSVAHMGYLLVALLAGARIGELAAIFYVASYLATSLAAFGVLGMLSGPEREIRSFSDVQGLFWQQPYLTFSWTLSILSLAGLPLTAGFMAKFQLVAAGVSAGLWVLVVILVLNSAIGLYYYLKFIGVLFAEPPPAAGMERVRASAQSQPLGAFAMAGLSAVMIWLGVYPSSFLHWFY